MFELTITDGQVTGIRAIDRGAGDTASIQLARAEHELWNFKDQNADMFKDV